MPLRPEIPNQLLIDAVTKQPGLSSYEYADILNLDPFKVKQRLYALTNVRSFPMLKRVRLDGLFRFYPFNYSVEANPFEGRTALTVNVDNEAVRLVKVTPEDLQKIERSKYKSKYTEILNAVEELEVGEGFYFRVGKLNTHGVRDAITRFYKDQKKFTTKTDGTFMSILRTA